MVLWLMIPPTALKVSSPNISFRRGYTDPPSPAVLCLYKFRYLFDLAKIIGDFTSASVQPVPCIKSLAPLLVIKSQADAALPVHI